MEEYPRFLGNCPRNVAKDAKYHIRSSNNGPVAALFYWTTDDERWYATTESHPELVRMVNDVKIRMGQSPNGAFYINEFRQVIVPAAGSDEYYLAGTYEKPLRFLFERKVLSGEPVNEKGRPLSPGDPWAGPHPGIPYVLTAGGNDIRYTFSPRPNVEKEVRLSRAIGDVPARRVAAQIREIKGFSGGRFYVNECRTIFAPVDGSDGWHYTYVGQLDLSRWFPIPNQ